MGVTFKWAWLSVAVNIYSEMASNKRVGKVLCKYYMSNCCVKGDLCPFSHDWKDKPVTVCQYYLKGTCAVGKNCRYDHVWPNERGGATSTAAPAKEVGGAKSRLPQPMKISVPDPVNLPSLSSTHTGAPDTSHVAPSSRKMVVLRGDPSRNPKKWVQAAEFVPGNFFHGPPNHQTAPQDTAPRPDEGVASPQLHSTYSDALGLSTSYMDVISMEEAASLLCPFAEMGQCPFEECDYLHGDICDMCNRQCLNPFDPEQQKAHRKSCLDSHEREMERAFQVQESAGKQCAICMECVVSKFIKSERRFGILADCDHCFCLACIRKWRSSARLKTIRACPLCRVVSFYVIPSEVWIDDEKQKQKLLQEYKDNLGKKHCKYFSMGEGTCPFGSSCFYRHEFPDGRKAVDIPRFYEDAEGERKPIKTNLLWDYLNNREEETLDSLLPVSSAGAHAGQEHQPSGVGQEHQSSGVWAEHALTSEQEEAWLNYEPDLHDLEFL